MFESQWVKFHWWFFKTYFIGFFFCYIHGQTNVHYKCGKEATWWKKEVVCGSVETKGKEMGEKKEKEGDPLLWKGWQCIGLLPEALWFRVVGSSRQPHQQVFKWTFHSWRHINCHLSIWQIIDHPILFCIIGGNLIKAGKACRKPSIITDTCKLRCFNGFTLLNAHTFSDNWSPANGN